MIHVAIFFVGVLLGFLTGVHLVYRNHDLYKTVYERNGKGMATQKNDPLMEALNRALEVKK